MGLQQQQVVEHAQVRRLVPVDVVRRRVVAQHHHFGALQAHDAKGLGPTAVVANAHAHAGVHGVPHLEAFVAHLEVLFLQVLKWRGRFVVVVAGQVHLAVATDDVALSVHDDGCVEALALRGQFGIAQVKANAILARQIKQRLHIGVGHGRFKVAVDLGLVGHPVAREKRGQRQLGKHHKVGVAGVGLFEQFDQAGHHGGLAVAQVDGAELGDGQGEGAFHDNLGSKDLRKPAEPVLAGALTKGPGLPRAMNSPLPRATCNSLCAITTRPRLITVVGQPVRLLPS